MMNSVLVGFLTHFPDPNSLINPLTPKVYGEIRGKMTFYRWAACFLSKNDPTFGKWHFFDPFLTPKNMESGAQEKIRGF